MLNWIKRVIIKLGTSKFGKFLLEVFAGKTGEFLNENYKLINEAVKLTENISNYIKAEENKYKDLVDIKRYVDETYACSIENKDIQSIIDNGWLGKFSLARKLSIQFIQSESKEFATEIIESALQLGIQLAVNRFFGK